MTQVRNTTNATLDLPFNSTAWSESPPHDGYALSYDAKRAGCVTQISVWNRQWHQLNRNWRSCTSCDSGRVFMPSNMKDKAGACKKFMPNSAVGSFCTRLDVTGNMAAPDAPNLFCTKWARLWNVFARSKLMPNARKWFEPVAKIRNPARRRRNWLRPSWARAQCELVKYTACRFDPETKAIGCVAKKSVKCVTVCASV